MHDASGIRVLIVEDEGVVAFMIEEALEELGCKIVAWAGKISQAEKAISTTEFDLALLDINLAGETTFDIARNLASRGIPFIFSTGYGIGGVPSDLQDRPVLTKPFSSKDLQNAVKSTLQPTA